VCLFFMPTWTALSADMALLSPSAATPAAPMDLATLLDPPTIVPKRARRGICEFPQSNDIAAYFASYKAPGRRLTKGDKYVRCDIK
jgi:hypothetical protein